MRLNLEADKIFHIEAGSVITYLYKGEQRTGIVADEHPSIGYGIRLLNLDNFSLDSFEFNNTDEIQSHPDIIIQQVLHHTNVELRRF